MEASIATRSRPPVLSGRLAALDLTTIGAAALASVIRDEALELFDADRAIVWAYRPALGRLFAEQEGDLRSVEVTSAEARDVLGKASLWATQVVGIRRRLAEESFGAASGGEPAPTLAIPLHVGGVAAGLLLVRLREWEDAGEVLGCSGPFASQAAALLANQEALERARRNESQLTALYETAGEISSKLELETVLAAIIERARALAAAPIAYIMLVDQSASEIFMRVSAGVSSPTFGEIRLRLGAGLGGMVALEKQPFYTSDYLNDGRFNHQPMVDDEVRREEIKSIVGVPMKASDTFVGVLYVADRSMRAFTDAEVDVLASLAHHAALAIENAALYEQATTALAELKRASRLVQMHNRRLERADQVHSQLSEIVLAGHGLAGVVNLMAELVGEPAVVLDEHHRVIAAAGFPSDTFGERLTGHGLDDSLLADNEVRSAIDRVAAFVPTVIEPRSPGRSNPRLVVPIVAGAELLGSVWVESRPEAIEEERPLIEQAARVVGLELLKERSIVDAERRLRRELLEELLAARVVEGPTLARRAAQLGVDLEVPYRLAVAELAGRGSSPTGTGLAERAKERLIAALREQAWCDFAGEAAGRVVALVRPEAEGLVDDLARALEGVGDAVQARAVVSPACSSPGDYRSNFVACDRVLQLAGASSRIREPVVDLEEALALTLLFREGGEADLRRFAETRLRAILRQRAGPRSELLRTLEAYFDSGLSPTKTGQALNVHVNTVYYRLKRLRALLGADFAAPRRALDLQIALLAHRLSDLH